MKRRVVVIAICIIVILLGFSAYFLYADLIFGELGTTSTTTEFSDLAKLAYGTVALGETEYAVTTKDAQSLLNLWEMTQVLASDDTTTEAEIEVMCQSIESAMTEEQLAAIEVLKLDSSTAQDYILSNGTTDTNDLLDEESADSQAVSTVISYLQGILSMETTTP